MIEGVCYMGFLKNVIDGFIMCGFSFWECDIEFVMKKIYYDILYKYCL